MRVPWYELASAVIAIGVGAIVWFALEPKPIPTEIVEQHAPIALMGEWVTHPDGRRVCRLRVDLFYGQVMEASDCEDYAEKIPFRGQIVDWLRGPPGQINVNGEWRP